MILRPLNPSFPAARRDEFISAWSAIQKIQNECRDEGWLITQPAHAALAGEIAQHLHWPGLPPEAGKENDHQPGAEAMRKPGQAADDDRVTEDDPGGLWLRAISLHDSGWGPVDAAVIRKLQGSDLRSRGPQALRGAGSPPARAAKPAFIRPVSFINFPPAEALSAWIASIEICEAYAPIAGYMVSRHFCRLSEDRITGGQPPESAQAAGSSVPLAREHELFKAFVAGERARQQRLLPATGKAPAELEARVDQLQFCDVLSLYICSGAAENVVLQLGSEPIRLVRHATGCTLQPSPFRQEVVVTVSALRYPRPEAQSGEPNSAAFEFSVA